MLMFCLRSSGQKPFCTSVVDVLFSGVCLYYLIVLDCCSSLLMKISLRLKTGVGYT